MHLTIVALTLVPQPQGVAFLPLPDASLRENVHKRKIMDMEIIVCESFSPEVNHSIP